MSELPILRAGEAANAGGRVKARRRARDLSSRAGANAAAGVRAA